MAKPTLTASTVGKEKANAAFKRLGKTQDFIAGTSGTTRQLVSKFLSGLSVEQQKFIAICEALDLKWQEISELEEVVVTDDSHLKKLERLVQEVRQKIAADVKERCGTMRVLDMSQPVDLDRIYTDVNIIKDVTGRRRIGYDEVMEVCTREHFDRFLVGTIQERVTGLKAVDEIQKLVVLGKPGAGKTTFMKYLAMSCLGGRFHGELVPIFVTLKAYAETKGAPSLQEYIFAEFQQRKVGRDAVERLLDEGKALILLDGLDEVKKEDDRRVKQDIDQFSRDWLKNRFAITCRIAAREYKFEKFTEVEVADFDDQQIATFVNNWFREKDETKAKRLLERLEDNEPVKELATNPLLLTLLCLIFEKTDRLHERQSELFKEGLDLLFQKWDREWDVDRDIPKHFRGENLYKNLSSEDKANMIGKIAFNSFVKGEYFFRQEDLQRQIKDYIVNLPEASADPDVLRLDSEVVLKAIEHHHGLLVERARNIYSFSHLTFQEYFAAREIERDRHFDILVQNISNPRWKEVFYLTAEMLRRSDNFLRLMKDRVDGILARDEKLQAFLEWANQKTNSVQFREFSYKTVAVRAFYAAIARAHVRGHAIILAVDLDHTFAHTFPHVRPLDLDLDLDLDLNDLDLNDLDLDRTRAFALTCAVALTRAVARAKEIGDKRLYQCLQDLKSRFPDPYRNWEGFKKWRKLNGQEWIKEYRQVLIDRRNIGHDWQFTDEQVELLQKYYEANILLVQCMNRSYVSKEVREEIEATLLLPVKEKVEGKK